MVRRSSTDNLSRIRHILGKIQIVRGDLTDQTSLDDAIKAVCPDEVYNLAALSFVADSWNQPFTMLDINGLGPVRLLEACRKHKPDIKFYQASSSEMYGAVKETPQREITPFNPKSIYGIAKLAAHWAVTNYRNSYGMFACAGICFNAESERRGLEFVTRKITYAVARIKHRLQDKLSLGNLNAIRDWGYAPEYVRAMFLMLQQSKPDDFVIATGEAHTVGEWVEAAFCHAGLNWLDHVVIDESLRRPAEVDLLLGDATKARWGLGWEPKMKFEQIVKIMVDADIELVKEGANNVY